MAAPARNPAPTILFFHGNAGNMGFRLENLQLLYRQLNTGGLRVNILAVDYRGYGDSDDVKPDEKGLMADGEAVLKFARQHPAVDAKHVMVFGRSLGGAVAIYLASAFPGDVAGMIVENTFFNVSLMVDKLFAWLSVFKRLILRINWPSDQRVPLITAPALFIRGAVDKLVPPAHSEMLAGLATSSKFRKLYTVQTGGHNDTWQKGGVAYMATIREFVMRRVLGMDADRSDDALDADAAPKERL